VWCTFRIKNIALLARAQFGLYLTGCPLCAKGGLMHRGIVQEKSGSASGTAE
jgi:hypothetical protein